MTLALLTVAAPGGVDAARGSLATLVAILPNILLAAAVYAGTHLLWRLEGRPDGFETNMLHYARLVRSGVQRRLRER